MTDLPSGQSGETPQVKNPVETQPQQEIRSVEQQEERIDQINELVDEMREKRDEVSEEARQRFKEAMAKSPEGIDYRQENKYKDQVNDILNTQLVAIQDSYEKAIKEFRTRAKTWQGDLKNLKDELITPADAKGKSVAEALRLDLQNTIAGGIDVTTAEKLEQSTETLEKMNPELAKIYQNILEEKQLSAGEYNTIIDHINPFEVTAPHEKTPMQTTQATATGLIIGAMSEGQRQELLNHFFSSSKKDQSMQLIEMMLANRLLDPAQAEAILQKAVDQNAVSPEQSNEIKEKIQKGTYQEEQKKIQEQLRAAILSKYSETDARNAMSRFIGMPGLKFAGAGIAWLTVILNAASNGWNPVANPYGIIGGAAALWLGRDTMRSMGFDPTAIFNTPDEDREKELDNNREERFFDNYKKIPENIKNYLRSGGFATIQNIRSLALAQGKDEISQLKKEFDFENLFKAEQNSALKDQLETMKPQNQSDKEKMTETFLLISESVAAMKIQDQKAFNDLDERSRKNTPLSHS